MKPAMIHAGALGNVPEFFAGEIGWRRVEAIFSDVGIPVGVTQHPEWRVPWSAVSAVIENCARAVGDASIGLVLCRHTSLDTYGAWGQYLRSAPTLRDALHRGYRTLHFHSPGDAIALVRVPGRLRLYYRFAVLGGFGSDNASYCAASVMLSMIRAYAGPAWTPRRLQLSVPGIRNESAISEAFSCDVVLGGSAIAFDIPDDVLDLPRPPSRLRAVTLADVERARRSHPPVTLSDAVVDVLRVQLLDHAPALDRVARILDMGPRRLQRALEVESVSYRELERRMVIGRAQDMLRDGHSVTETATCLYYASPNHFSRAFVKATGTTPGEFRRRNANPKRDCALPIEADQRGRKAIPLKARPVLDRPKTSQDFQQ
jgi:AraC-like DNA-binding protein